MSKLTPRLAGFALAAVLVTFASTTSAQAQSCGNGNTQPSQGEVCDNGGANNTQAVGCCAAGCTTFVSSATQCRAATGVCDTVAEFCTGSSGTCPVDVLSPSTVVCRPSLAGVCDTAETCTGTSNACPADTVAASTVPCRASAGVCDSVENCTGTSGACPGDAKSSAVCRADSGVCDPGAETCDGTSNDCPADSFTAGGTPCRASGGVCDPAEACTGTSSTCPADAKSTSECREADGVCDVAESCDGTNNNCPVDAKSTAVCRPAVSELCDVVESCDGTNNDCPVDELFECEDDDDVACTEATCDPTEGCIVADNCVEICRSPGFWQTHSGSEKGENIGQAVLDDVGTLRVCGEWIQVTDDLGYLTSSLEGLCVRTQGVKNRQLYRQLVTTAFNCAISEGGDCDDVLEGIVDVTFSECDDVCRYGEMPDGPTLEECKDQLGCFNGGGRWIDGECARGTCAEDTDEYCGGDYGDCPLLGEEEQDCVRFADSCASVALCSEDLDAPATICPKPGPASSPKTCRDARRNDCTIDDCPIAPGFSCDGYCTSAAPGGCYCDVLSCSLDDGCKDRDQVCPAVCDE